MKKKAITTLLALTVSILISACGAEQDAGEAGRVEEQTEGSATRQKEAEGSSKTAAKESSISAGIDESTTNIFGECGDDLMWYFQETDGTLVIRGTGDMHYLTFEAPWDQYRDDIHTVIIEDGCTLIARQAFFKCRLESVTLPDTVTVIENAAFSAGKFGNHITELVLPVNLTSIGREAFFGCELERVTIPEGVTFIGESAFVTYRTTLEEVIVENADAEIHPKAFSEGTKVIIAGEEKIWEQ